MATSTRFTSRDLEVMPEDGKRREIIDGDLLVSKQPDFRHQTVSSFVWRALQGWSETTRLGIAAYWRERAVAIVKPTIPTPQTRMSAS
jgi:hypothetical protein